MEEQTKVWLLRAIAATAVIVAVIAIALQQGWLKFEIVEIRTWP